MTMTLLLSFLQDYVKKTSDYSFKKKENDSLALTSLGRLIFIGKFTHG